MNTPDSRSFCPHCQADWDQPWYDCCPACGHRFTSAPWWRSPWLAVPLVCIPAAAVLALTTLPGDLLGEEGRTNLLIAFTFLATGLAAVLAGTVLAAAIRGSTLRRVLFAILFVPFLYALGVCLCFFACTAGNMG